MVAQQLQGPPRGAQTHNFVRKSCDGLWFGKILEADQEHAATGGEGGTGHLARQWAAARQDTQRTRAHGVSQRKTQLAKQ
jgi:hypothetical protein